MTEAEAFRTFVERDTYLWSGRVEALSQIDPLLLLFYTDPNMAKHTVLCVDDEKDNVDALERLFRKKYSVLKATSGKEALELLKEYSVSLIISDQRMPQMTGVEFLNKSLKTHPDAMRILLTGYTDIESVIAAINSGQVYRYINKPWDPVDLQNTVDTALERYEMRHELKEKNEALKTALAELKVLDESKSNFMLLINHELKTPLTGMLSYLQLLEESKLSDDQTLYVDRIRKSADRLNDLIHDSLELVSAETGLTKVKRKKWGVEKIVENVTSQFKMAAADKGMDFATEVAGSQISADQEILTNVLSRLIDNAIKFGDENTKIEVKAESRGGQVHFAIRNHGKKILDKKMIQKILQPFSLDENIMNHSKGTGLGLSVCQALLKIHDSYLDIQSEKNNFVVSFPITEA